MTVNMTSGGSKMESTMATCIDSILMARSTERASMRMAPSKVKAQWISTQTNYTLKNSNQKIFSSNVQIFLFKKMNKLNKRIRKKDKLSKSENLKGKFNLKFSRILIKTVKYLIAFKF